MDLTTYPEQRERWQVTELMVECSQASPLLAIPTELRRCIYDYLFNVDEQYLESM